MYMNLKTYLSMHTLSEKSTEQETFLKMLCKKETIDVMWQTFTLQCNAAMKGNEKNVQEVYNVSTRYLAALVICKTLYIRYISSIRIMSDLKDLMEFDISDIYRNCILKHGLFKEVPLEKKDEKIVELLKKIQKPIFQKGVKKEKILWDALQKHYEIIYTAMLINNDGLVFALIQRIYFNFVEHPKTGAALNMEHITNQTTYNGLLCNCLYNILDKFHEYIADISNITTNAQLPPFFLDVDASKKILTVLKWSNIKKQGSNNNNINCVARMKYNSQIYWAVNGAPKDVKNPATNAEKLNILGVVLQHFSGKHVVVKLKTTQTSINRRTIDVDPKVYFPSIGKTVSLTSYRSKIPKINVRLFSCCERKLIAAVQYPETDSFSIDVIKPPCELCLAAKEYLNNPNFQLNYANFLLVEAYDELHSLDLI